MNYDCSLREVQVNDSSCNNLCPVVETNYKTTNTLPKEEVVVGRVVTTEEPTTIPQVNLVENPLNSGEKYDLGITVNPTPSQSLLVEPSNPLAESSSAPSSNYSCDCKKACRYMVSCDEAYFQLNTCHCAARDADNDGVPCEDICK
ncbi:MAG: hypothetical protein Q9M76_04370 [Candidatus Dojkabacteria bacterium]|nr:hypothetical protein [Candidatus Dojkabacteria bacterium]